MDKIQAAVRETVLAHAALGEEALAAAGGAATVPDLIDALEGAGFLVEATRCFAHALPRREAVWWAAMCARHTAPADLAETGRATLDAVELWVRQQNEEGRRAAMSRAEAIGFQTPEAWAAVAAFWSGPSISPPDQPPVPPPAHLTGVAVAGAVALAAVRGDAQRSPARLAQFLRSAREIAAGGVGRLPPEAEQ